MTVPLAVPLALPVVRCLPDSDSLAELPVAVSASGTGTATGSGTPGPTRNRRESPAAGVACHTMSTVYSFKLTSTTSMRALELYRY